MNCSIGEPNKYFQEAFDVLANVKEEKKIAFVHCTSGKNIAPTILLAYMMMSSARQEKHLPLNKALQYVQSKAINAQPTDQFLEQLVDLEVELFEEPSIKIKRTSTGGGSGRGGRGGRGGKGKRGK